MQPIVWMAIIGVAITGLGMGFLAPGFDLNVQQLGAQEEDLVAPISSASVDFQISAINGQVNGKPVFKNTITACSFHSYQSFGKNGVIICKLSDIDSDIVAEGRLVLTTAGYKGSTTTYIPINNLVDTNPPSNEVQNIFDVKIVVLGDNPTP